MEIQRRTLDKRPIFSYNRPMAKAINLNLDDDEQIEKIANALTSKARRQIIRMSTENCYSVMQIAEKLNMPVSTVSFHLKMLKDAGLINILPSSSRRGNEKVILQNLSVIKMNFQMFYKQSMNTKVVDIPIGCYSDFKIEPPCSLADSEGLLIGWDMPEVFYSPKRFDAKLLSFSKGYVEYCIPVFELEGKNVAELMLSLELCSECPMYNNNWKSDITFWLNGVEVCTYHSLGDYGGRPGKNTPPFWPANATQFGMLKKISVKRDGTYIDQDKVSNVTVTDCDLSAPVVKIRIGIKEDAKFVGGINLFGDKFGDTDQNIVLEIAYSD